MVGGVCACDVAVNADVRDGDTDATPLLSLCLVTQRTICHGGDGTFLFCVVLILDGTRLV